MPIADDPEEFVARWHDHIVEFEALKQTLDTDDWDELDQLEEQLKSLVEKAAEEIEE